MSATYDANGKVINVNDHDWKRAYDYHDPDVQEAKAQAAKRDRDAELAIDSQGKSK
ncbi:MAG: hypothetical protein LBI17_02690 [Rickettsiales bacterium]|jgi:hypothetical protein|nr:hypothetical protein [Rickettsiales bacterium]